MRWRGKRPEAVGKDNPRSSPRHRDATATRRAIVDAATIRFGQESYDRVGLREIALDAGVDAALIVRYFGSKEGLLKECLASTIVPALVSRGKRSEFGENLMAVFFDPQDHDVELNSLKLLLRSATIPALEPILKDVVHHRLMAPFIEWLGGDDAPMRAQLINLLAMGASLQPLVVGSGGLSDQDRARFRGLMARSIQRLIDGTGFDALERALDAAPNLPPATERPSPAEAAPKRKRS
jgi:AcrR family transcriptional regulator